MTDTTVTVNVTDVAEAPAFAQAGHAFDLAEDTDGSTNRVTLGTVSATDPDGGSVTYSIEGGKHPPTAVRTVGERQGGGELLQGTCTSRRGSPTSWLLPR